MSDKESHTIRNGVIATVIGGIVLAILIPPTRAMITTLLGASIATPVPIPCFLLIILLALAIPTLLRMLRAMGGKKKDTEASDNSPS